MYNCACMRLLYLYNRNNAISVVSGLDDSDRSGRPRITSVETDNKIEMMAEEKKFTVPKQIKSELQLDCSSRTIRRRLDEVGLYGRVSRTEYVFDERDIQRRLSFAQGYAKW